MRHHVLQRTCQLHRLTRKKVRCERHITLGAMAHQASWGRHTRLCGHWHRRCRRSNSTMPPASNTNRSSRTATSPITYCKRPYRFCGATMLNRTSLPRCSSHAERECAVHVHPLLPARKNPDLTEVVLHLKSISA